MSTRRISTREKDMTSATALGFNDSPHYANRGATAFADGCAHRDAQMIAWLRKQIESTGRAYGATDVGRLFRTAFEGTITHIERGDHVP